MSDENQVNEINLITKHDFFFEVPLYKELSISDIEDDFLRGDVDAYSAINSTDTTYSVSTVAIDCWDRWDNVSQRKLRLGFYLVTLTCKRKENDVLRFVLFRGSETIRKIGQFPSLADLQFSELGKKYDKVLPEDDLKNLKKAIGLVAHGAGAGSFVYLRRIFENLIFESFNNNVAALGLTEDVFRLKKMEEKIEILKEFLPSELIELKSIYGILSSGVHELSEEDCLRYFSPLKLCIELILDQKIAERAARDRSAVVKKQLQDIHKELGASV